MNPASMALSKEFCPSGWECPHCHKRGASIFRGSCSHDVCKSCLSASINRRNLVKRTATRKRGDESVVEVACPIDACTSGKFVLEKSKFGGEQNSPEVIDLCDDDEDTTAQQVDVSAVVKKEKAKASSSPGPNCNSGAAKAEVKKEKGAKPPVKKEKQETPTKTTAASSPAPDTSNAHNIVSPLPAKRAEPPVKKEKLEMSTKPAASSTSPSTNTSNTQDTKKSNLKPLFEVGDPVYAAWKDINGDVSWYPGTVKSYVTKGESEYGPLRIYHVNYDDGDTSNNIEDHWIMSKEDYELTEELGEKGRKGVKERRDRKSTDQWASKVGWYEVKIGGVTRRFSLLSEAMKAHDACKSDDSSEGGNSDDESDVESRFSEGDLSSEEEFDEEDGGKKAKRRRLNPSAEANIPKDKFWEVNRADIQFTGDAFKSKSIFHLNSFVNGQKKKNQAFALFIREGVATPGFDPVPKSIDANQIAGMSQTELREAITAIDGGWGAGQTALWLKKAAVGSFVILRHEYPKCRFCPDRLKDEDGQYIGPVYVIGIVTKKVVPWSAEETDLAEKRMGEFHRVKPAHRGDSADPGGWHVHNLCRVSWRRMGYKKDLKDPTRGYISKICQPTLAHILKDPTKVHEGMTMEDIREDLWNNATIPIRADEFNDKFNHKGETGPVC